MDNKPHSKLWDQSCILASLAEGIDVLHEASKGPEECESAKRARNAIKPAIDAVIEKAWALNAAIEAAERTSFNGPHSTSE